MSAERASTALHEAISRRAAEIGVPVWLFDAGGRMAAGPRGPAGAPRLLESAAIGELVAGAVRTHVPGRQEPVRVADGLWAAPLEQRRGGRVRWLFACLIGTTELAASEQFSQWCGACGADVASAANALALRLRDSEADVAMAAKALRWGLGGLARTEADAVTIEQFSGRLGQAYEEINVLFGLARYLNYSSDPAKVIEVLTRQLHGVLPFDWLGILFAPNGTSVRELEDRSFFSGKPPCPEAELLELARPLLLSAQQQTGDDYTRVLSPKSNALAARTGAEALAEPIRHDGRLVALLIAGNKHGPETDLSSFETQFVDAAADFLGIFHENIARFAEQHELFVGTLSAWTSAIDAKDHYTRGHSQRVGLLASLMADALGCDAAGAETHRIAGLVHDVGKIGVPEAVLCKQGRLSEAEMFHIKQHPEIGYGILKDIPSLSRVWQGVLHHHERWDGGGYPKGLAGDAIPRIARVLAVCDTFDAMSSTRSYRPAMPRQRLDEIHRCSGSQFEPLMAETFLRLDLAPFDALLDTHAHINQAA